MGFLHGLPVYLIFSTLDLAEVGAGGGPFGPAGLATALPYGYEGFVYFFSEGTADHQVVVQLGSEEPVTHSCAGLESACLDNGGVFSEAPCDRSTAVGECVWSPRETLVFGSAYCSQAGNGSPEDLCNSPVNNGSGEYTELNGGCP